MFIVKKYVGEEQSMQPLRVSLRPQFEYWPMIGTISTNRNTPVIFAMLIAPAFILFDIIK